MNTKQNHAIGRSPMKTCQDEFDAAVGERCERPLPSGYYKLHESHHHLLSIAEDLRDIASHVSGRRYVGACFNHCLPGMDMAVWLKRVPHMIARRIGYELLPGVKALVHNDVPQEQINLLYPKIELGVHELLPKLEAVRLRIAKNIKAEYESMKRGAPNILPLVIEAIWLTERALDLYEQHRPTGPELNTS